MDDVEGAPLASSGSGISSNLVDRLRIRHLRLLELIATTGSLTAAAEALHISQPGATRMLQELERAFGCRLIDRSKRGGALSAAGEQALQRLRVALGAIDAAGEAIAASLPETPVVRIGMLPLAGVALLPRLVSTLRRNGSRLQLQLVEGSVSRVLHLLRSGDIDCVIGRLEADGTADGHGDFDVVALSEERLEVACARGHRLPRDGTVALQLLQREAWIVPPRGTYTRQAFDAAFRCAALTPPVPFLESPSFHTSLATVAETDLLTVAPRSAVSYYCSLSRVRRLNLPATFPSDSAVYLTLRGVPKIGSLGPIEAALRTSQPAADGDLRTAADPRKVRAAVQDRLCTGASRP